jgi:hypothetical protein
MKYPEDEDYQYEIVQRANAYDALLREVGLCLRSFDPGVRATDERGREVHLNYDAWELAQDWIAELRDLRARFLRLQKFLDADEQGRQLLIEYAIRRQDRAEALYGAFRQRVERMAENYKGDHKNAVALLRNIAGWHRASADTPVSDREADLLLILSDEFDRLLGDLGNGDL